jgi:hypothetical protein
VSGDSTGDSNSNGVMPFSPVLADEIGLRRVVDGKRKQL